MLYWVASTVLSSTDLPVAVDYLVPDGGTYEVMADDPIPLEAMPVVMTRKRGKAKWTISIPRSLEFPLKPSDYANICRQSDEISEKLQGIKGAFASTGGSFRYGHLDPSFVDVQEAERDGLLPAASESAVRLNQRPIALEVEKEYEDGNQGPLHTERKKIFCERSLTYVLETTNAGLGKTLMGLWMSYGLAKEEGRAFFIDDTNWYF